MKEIDGIDWRRRREKCPFCGQISLYRMPIHTHTNRCENPNCDLPGIKVELEPNQIRKLKVKGNDR